MDLETSLTKIQLRDMLIVRVLRMTRPTSSQKNRLVRQLYQAASFPDDELAVQTLLTLARQYGIPYGVDAA
jgi:hypothetical protein